MAPLELFPKGVDHGAQTREASYSQMTESGKVRKTVPHRIGQSQLSQVASPAALWYICTQRLKCSSFLVSIL